MNLLEKIEVSTESRAVAIFYQHYKSEVKINFLDNSRTEQTIESSKHCELFTFDCLKSVGLNEKSFVLRFIDRNSKTPRSLFLTLESRDQLQQLETLVEETQGQALKVKEFYANISLRNTIQKKS